MDDFDTIAEAVFQVGTVPLRRKCWIIRFTPIAEIQRRICITAP